MKIVAAKAKAKADKEKAKVAKAKAKAKVKQAKDKAKAKALAKKSAKAKDEAPRKPVAKASPKPSGRAAAGRAAAAAAAPPVAKQHTFLDHAKSFDFKTVREMLEETPELVNVQPANRWSALHQAAEAGKPTAVKMLLSKGADVNLKTKDGRTPQDVAHSSCAALLAPAVKRARGDD